MIIGIGIDIIEISRIEKVISRKDTFLERVFTQNERKYFKSRGGRAEVVAGNFAAKEAVVKAMSVGFRNFEFKDIEVLRDVLGKPYVILHNNAKSVINSKCMIHVSISHSRNNAVANAVIETWDGEGIYEYSYMCTDERD